MIKGGRVVLQDLLDSADDLVRVANRAINPFRRLDIVEPVCPVCGGVMWDFAVAGCSRRPRFVCRDGGCGFRGDVYEDSRYRTALWRVGDLRNGCEYGEAELLGRVERLVDNRENRLRVL